MSKADNPTLNYYALKLALALKSEDGNNFCQEYDNLPVNQLTQDQVDWIKEKARSDSALPHPTLLARMKWFKDKVLPTSTLPTSSPSKSVTPANQAHAVISEKTESEYHSAVSNLKSRMNSIVDNPILKSGLGSYGGHGDGYASPALETSDGNKNYLSVNPETRESLFNGFHEGDIEMVDLSRKRTDRGYTEVNIDEAVEFGLCRNQESEENQSGDGKNSDPAGKKKKKKKKRKSFVSEEMQKEEKEQMENAEKKVPEGKSRAQRRKKLKQIKEEEKGGSTRGKLEEGNASELQVIQQTPPETAIVERKPRKRTVASMRQEKEARNRFFAQATNGEGIIPIITLGPSHPNMTHILQVPSTSERSVSSQPILNAIEQAKGISDTPKTAQVAKPKRTRPDSDDVKSPEAKDEPFPTWVIEHDSRKDKKKKRKSRVGQKTSVQNDSTNSEHSNSDQTSQTKNQAENSKRSSDRSASVSSPEPTGPVSEPDKEIEPVFSISREMSDDVLVVDDGSWEMIGAGKNEKKRKGEIKHNIQFSSNQSSLSDKSSLYTEKVSETTGPANLTSSSSSQHPQTIPINDSSTPELGVNNEELWPGLTAANANFPVIKSKKTMSFAQRLKRNKSSDSDSDAATITTEPQPEEIEVSDDQLDSDGQPEDQPVPEIVESEDSILDQILGPKLSGLNFLVGSCEDLSQEKSEPITDAVAEVHNDVRFIFVDDDLDDDINTEITQTPTNGPATESGSSSTAISNTNSSLSGDLVNKLLSNQIAKKIFIQTDVTIPDYHALIKFHEKRLRSVLEREQNGGTKTIRYNPFHDLHEKLETVTSS